MPASVLIPAAGLGERISRFSLGFPKPLLTYGGWPIISHIVRQYASEEIVIGVGHGADLIRQTVELLHSKDVASGRIRLFETTSHLDGRGLRGTLLDAESSVTNEQLIFHAVDTLVPTWRPEQRQELLGMERPTAVAARVKFPGDYRVITESNCIGERRWTRRGDLAYAGLSTFPSTSAFFDSLKKDETATESEVLQDLGANVLELDGWSWIDCGNPAELEAFSNQERHIANVLPKFGEVLWIDDEQMMCVVKGSLDANFIKERTRRASQELAGFVPEILSESKNFYSYRFCEGETLASLLDEDEADLSALRDFLQEFWGKIDPNPLFDGEWEEFYRGKTESRLLKVPSEYRAQERTINGIFCPSIDSLVEAVNWAEFARIRTARVHGDLHPENILVSESGITLLDWRQGFDRAVAQDFRYDLFKLLHGSLLRHESISNGDFELAQGASGTLLKIDRGPQYVELGKMALEICEEHGVRTDELLLGTGLIFLNIAPLHDPPEYSLWLMHLGQFLASMALSDHATSHNTFLRILQLEEF